MKGKARWGPFSFLCSPSKIVPLDNFSTSISLKTDSGNDTSGTSASNTRGLETQPMSFSTTYMRALGVDPRERFEAWKGQIGKSYPFYFGSKRFGPAKMELTGVSVSDLLTDNDGNFISITLDITLQEKGNSKKTTTTSKTSTGGTSQTSGSTSSKAAETYAKTVEKKKAMNATASTSDRNTKKVLTLKEKRLGQ